MSKKTRTSSNFDGHFFCYLRMVINSIPMKLHLLLITLFLSFLNSKAQDSSACDVKLNGNYFASYWTDSKKLVSAPTKWKKKEWFTFGGVAATSTLLYFFVDQDLKDWSQKNITNESQDVADVVEKFGNGRYPVFTTAGLYLYGSILKKEKSKRVALLMLESYALTGIASQLAKFSSSRHRPWNDAKYNEWDGPRVKDVYASFFSGHSSTAFSFATILATEFKDKKWVAPTVYSIASLSAMSRVHDNAHWASDVFVGSAVGYFFGKALVKYHTCENPKLSISPTVLIGGISGLSFKYNL